MFILLTQDFCVGWFEEIIIWLDEYTYCASSELCVGKATQRGVHTPEVFGRDT